MSEYHVKANRDNREAVIERINQIGTVASRWKDGSFNFETFDNECEDRLCEILDAMEVERELL